MAVRPMGPRRHWVVIGSFTPRLYSGTLSSLLFGLNDFAKNKTNFRFSKILSPGEPLQSRWSPTAPEDFGDTLDDLKVISLTLCQHKIKLEKDAKPVVDHQRRLNPKTQNIFVLDSTTPAIRSSRGIPTGSRLWYQLVTPPIWPYTNHARKCVRSRSGTHGKISQHNSKT